MWFVRNCRVKNRNLPTRRNSLRTGLNRRLFLQPLEERAVPAAFSVTSLGDNGAATLRGALIGAGISLGPDTITFAVTGTIVLTTGELTVPGDVTILGPGASSLIVNAGGSSRVFNTSGATAGSAIFMSGLTITGGKAAGGAGLMMGDESLTMTNCTVSGNTSTADGGGIYITSASGSLELQGCTISNNATTGAGVDGGGIAMQFAGNMLMNNTTVSGNTSADNGGGIYFRNGGKFTITNSTISGNAGGSTTVSIGGGLYFFGTASGPLLIQNSTVSTNSIGGAGGGIVLANFSGGLSLQNTTLAFNASTAAGSTGGGIARTSGSGSLTLDSTIIAKNTSQSGTGPDWSFTSLTLLTGSGNLIGVSDSGNGLISATGNQFGVKANPLDPLLGSLQNNSGATKTHRPASNSPAVDKGTNPAGLGFDQRGVTRVIGAAADVGAVEAPSTIPVTNANDSGVGSLRRAIEDSNLDVGIFNGVSFDATFFATPRTINLTSGEYAVTEGASIVGPNNLTIDAGSLSRHFNFDGPGNFAAYLGGMTLTHGSAVDGASIYVATENVTLYSMTLTHNTASGDGGAIMLASFPGKLQINDSVISKNSAASDGGAISVKSVCTLNLDQTTIADNYAASDGGGIAMSSGGYLSVVESTLSGNVADIQTIAGNHGGGGIFFYGQIGGTFDILNCTISANKATMAQGGGVLILGFIGTPTIRNSTLTNNSAGVNSRGGGIALIFGTDEIQLDSSIVAGNNSPLAPDFFAATVNANASAVGSKTGIFTWNGDATSNSLVGANLKLGPLANNGGLTQTHMPAVDSLLVNKGANPASAPVDQRGTGYGRSRSGGVDIGAVEAPTNFVVTNANNSGAGSLRQAVTDANAFVGADTIIFDASYFSTPRTITLINDPLDISEAVTVVGPGSANVTVSGNNNVKIFTTTDAPEGAVINLSGMTLTAGEGYQGAALRVSDENVSVSSCVFTNNVSNNYGGAVGVIFGGSLTATDCTFTGNKAVEEGGAIFVSASSSASLTRCTVSGNQATAGGGIYASDLTLESCTVSGNQATGVVGGGQGGGILFSSYGNQAATFHNSTISGNKAQTDGGGIGFRGSNSEPLNILNTTIIGNTAVSGKGGGIARNTVYPINIYTSIVWNNNNASAPDVSSSGSVNVNFSAIGSAAGFTLTGSNNIPFGTDLKLGSLANNGGPTKTHRPFAGSPVIDAGSPMAVFGFDQRGVTRTLGKATDIGAFETASPLIVTNNQDDGIGSLRRAVSDANIDAGGNTITFDPVVFNSPQIINMPIGQIDITDAVLIQGPGASLASVNAQGLHPVFNVNTPATGVPVMLSGLTITGGLSGTSGGGIYNYDEALTLTDCVVSGNYAAEAGGGIFHASNLGGTILNNCTVANNSAGTHGGGLSEEGGGSATLTNCTFSGNSAYFAGGGIDMYFGGSLNMTGCTISGNQTFNNSGAGIRFQGAVGAGGLKVRNSTFSSNTAANSGGGIAVQGLVGTLSVQNCTFTANVTSGGKGGGIANVDGAGTVNLESSIISGNSTNVAGPDLFTPGAINATTCLIGSIAGVTTFNPDAVTTSLLGKAPLLGSLTNNGGPTTTHALLAGSPAINNGSNPSLQVTDQRGNGFVRVSNGSPDIGAFEVQPYAKVQSIVINNGDVQRSRVTTIAVNFDQLMTFPGTAESAFQLKRQSDDMMVGLSANVVNGATTTVNLTFTSGAAEFGSLADGRYTLSVLASGLPNIDGNNDGTPGDDYLMIGNTATNKLFRLYGDADGNGTVNQADFIVFRNAFNNGPSTAFDFDGDGNVTQADFIHFRNRFNMVA